MRRNFHVTTDRHVFWEQFYQVKGCSWTSGHTELRGQFTILRLWVGVAVREVQNGNYFLPIKPHSPQKKTSTELTLQLGVKTSVTAGYEDATDLYILPRCHEYEPVKVRSTPFSSGDVLDGCSSAERKWFLYEKMPTSTFVEFSEQSCDDCLDMTPLVNFSNIFIWCFRPNKASGIEFYLYSIGGKHFR